MKRIMLLTVIAAAAMLMVFAGSVAEASRWNRRHSRANIHYANHGFQGNHQPNYRGYSRPVHRYNYTPYRSWNGYGNTYYNPYQYGNGAYYGSNRAGIYFRF